ncbi:hypothetical protein Tco_1122479 [Tanacetum coccineum]|uniref:Uncharacterized protein n=1 Tax=Tanacetum coccineum TaxID=301880 RepID=A0ABQ5J0V9_9ASTR
MILISQCLHNIHLSNARRNHEKPLKQDLEATKHQRRCKRSVKRQQFGTFILDLGELDLTLKVSAYFRCLNSWPTNHADEDCYKLDEVLWKKLNSGKQSKCRNEKRIVAIEDSNHKLAGQQTNNEYIDWTKNLMQNTVTYAMKHMNFGQVDFDDFDGATKHDDALVKNWEGNIKTSCLDFEKVKFSGGAHVYSLSVSQICDRRQVSSQIKNVLSISKVQVVDETVAKEQMMKLFYGQKIGDGENNTGFLQKGLKKELSENLELLPHGLIWTVSVESNNKKSLLGGHVMQQFSWGFSGLQGSEHIVMIHDLIVGWKTG